MDLRFALLDAQGRLDPRDFGRALILLTGTMMIFQIATALVSPGFDLLQYALVYPYLCVFGKRLHDAGQTAWIWPALVVVYSIFTLTFTAILLPVLSPAAFAMQAELQAVALERGLPAVFEVIAERAPEIARASIVTTVSAFLLSSAAIGYPIFRLRSTPGPNRYGPAPASARPPGPTS